MERITAKTVGISFPGLIILVTKLTNNGLELIIFAASKFKAWQILQTFPAA